jgi:peptidylprolyl isomerase
MHLPIPCLNPRHARSDRGRAVRSGICALSFLAAIMAAQPAGSAPTTAAPAVTKGSRMITTASGLSYVDSVEGTGPSPKPNDTCVMHYTGWLSDGGKPGQKFDSSLDRGQSFAFRIGVGQVIKGWDEGVLTMKKGGKRTLHIPAALGYGARGAGGVIPPNADLIFEVELLDIR